jgi:hypothetical protein
MIPRVIADRVPGADHPVNDRDEVAISPTMKTSLWPGVGRANRANAASIADAPVVEGQCNCRFSCVNG